MGPDLVPGVALCQVDRNWTQVGLNFHHSSLHLLALHSKFAGPEATTEALSH
jgi:hypothetical protein